MTGLVASYHGTTLEFTKLLRATHSQMFVEAACRLSGLMLYTCDLDESGKMMAVPCILSPVLLPLLWLIDHDYAVHRDIQYKYQGLVSAIFSHLQRRKFLFTNQTNSLYLSDKSNCPLFSRFFTPRFCVTFSIVLYTWALICPLTTEGYTHLKSVRVTDHGHLVYWLSTAVF